jgi:two-component system response regulator ResD
LEKEKRFCALGKKTGIKETFLTLRMIWYKYTMPSRILIVEDENDLRVLYAQVLASAGYDVDQAQDGEVAMDKIKNTPWNLLLLDIMLPGRDGLRILKEMKSDPGLKKGPIVAITNLNSDYIVREAFNFGVDGYLIKSQVTPDKIADEIKEFLK